MSRVGIVGSRDFKDYIFMKNRLSSHKDINHIISGGQRSTNHIDKNVHWGADYYAEVYAREMQIPITIYHAEWNTLGKSAGYIRNGNIVASSDYIVAFWDGKSKGTKHTIDLAKKANKKVVIYKFESYNG